jgi:hypothetical protein
MFKSLIKFWNKPYPAMEEPKDNLWLAIIFGSFVFLFLLVFQPFDFIDHQKNTILVSAGFGVVTSIIVILNFSFLNNFVHKFVSSDDWKLKHTFYASIWNISTIAIGNYFYMVATSDIDNNFNEMFKALYYTVSIGIFPVIIILVYSEHQLLKKNQIKVAETVSIIENRPAIFKTKENNQKEILIKADIAADDFFLDIRNLAFIKAEGNYSTFFLENSDDNTGIIKRISLKSVEEQLKIFPNILRCHRSYIINIDKIKNVSGNARNISVSFEIHDVAIPISRTKEKEILASIRHLG